MVWHVQCMSMWSLQQFSPFMPPGTTIPRAVSRMGVLRSRFGTKPAGHSGPGGERHTPTSCRCPCATGQHRPPDYGTLCAPLTPVTSTGTVSPRWELLHMAMRGMARPVRSILYAQLSTMLCYCLVRCSRNSVRRRIKTAMQSVAVTSL